MENRSFPFSPTSSFWSTWRYTRFYMPELCSMCKMVILSVGKSVCPCVMWGVIRRDTGNIHGMGVFHPRLGTLLTQEDTSYTGANAMAICPSRCCVPSGTRCWQILFSFRYWNETAAYKNEPYFLAETAPRDSCVIAPSFTIVSFSVLRRPQCERAGFSLTKTTSTASCRRSSMRM